MGGALQAGGEIAAAFSQRESKRMDVTSGTGAQEKGSNVVSGRLMRQRLGLE